MSELEPHRIVRLEDDAVVVLDQRLLPGEEADLRCSTAAELAEAIRVLAVRGAPAIGVAAAYGMALAAEHVITNAASLERTVYDVPKEIDDEIARLKLATMGVAIDELTEEQAAYLASWDEGT